MLPDRGEILKATFIVKNIKILGNTSSATVNTTSNEHDNSNNTVNSNTTKQNEANNISSNTTSN